MGRGKTSAGGGRRRIREQRQGDLESLLAALDFDELMTVWARLGGEKRGPRPHSIEASVDAITDSGRSTQDILRTLQLVETEAPKKHCFFATLRGESPRAAIGGISMRKGTVAHGLRVSFVSEQPGDIISLTAERTVMAIDWVVSGERGSRKGHEVARKVRHATVVRIDFARRRALLTYPPLPPGAAETLEVVISSVLKLLDSFGIGLDPLPVRACLSSLLAAGARRVALSRGKFDTIDGKFHVTSKARTRSLDKVIAGLLSAGSNESEREEIERQISESLQKQSFQAVTLTWVDEKVSTRVEFIPVGAEFLFFWGRTDRTFANVDRMVGLLYDLSSNMQSADFRMIWNALADVPDGEIVNPGEFASRFRAPPDETRRALVEAVNAGLVVPVYRLNADAELLDEFDLHDWTSDLPSLRREFTSSAGIVVDGSDARNIRVGFRRTHYATQLDDR